MMLRNIAAIILLVLAAVILFAVLSVPASDSADSQAQNSFNLLEVGRAGDDGYAVVSYRGNADLFLLGYDSPPVKEVTILNESEGMEASRLGEFVKDLKPLEGYGFSVSVSDYRALGKGIFIVPSGAIPSYVLDDLRYNVTDAVVVLVGKSDLVLKNGIKKEEWYASLDQNQRKRVVIYNTTPGEFLDANNSLFTKVLENGWAVKRRENTTISGSGKHTATINLGKSEYLRLIYSIGEKKGIVDSVQMPSTGVFVKSEPASVFPWEKAKLTFSLNKTNGTAYLGVWRDGSEVYHEELIRVSEQNYFLKRLQLEKPGNHVVKVTDNSGTIGGGIVHVKDLEVAYVGSFGTAYLFNITLDGEPVDNEKVAVHLGNSTVKKTYFVSEGILSVPARLQKGRNIFEIDLLGTTKKVEVAYAQESLGELYLKYGLPGLLLILLVYFGARMTKRPVYVLRVGEVAGEIRKDVRMPAEKAINAFKSVRKELGIGKSPITAHEFSVALKRHVTDGADVTEGNVEEILQHLVKKGLLESHRQYYQVRGEGDIRKNAMARLIRDKLIQSGVKFRSKGRHFVTEHYEIGFFGNRFSKKAIVVVEDQQELDSVMSALDRKGLAELRIRMANDMIQFITIDRLDDVL